MKTACDLCGRGEVKYLAKVAGTEALVCERCASMGTIIEELQEKTSAQVRKDEKRKEVQRNLTVKRSVRTPEVVDDIGELVKEEREKRKWTQEELGQKIAEHASMVKRIEHGYIPTIGIAKKVERILSLQLVDYITDEEESYSSSQKKGGALTMGDVIVIRRKE